MYILPILDSTERLKRHVFIRLFPDMGVAGGMVEEGGRGGKKCDQQKVSRKAKIFPHWVPGSWERLLQLLRCHRMRCINELVTQKKKSSISISIVFYI